MSMKKWIEKLDGFLKLNDRNILENAGSITHELALKHAEHEYKSFHQQQSLKDKLEADQRDIDSLMSQLRKTDELDGSE